MSTDFHIEIDEYQGALEMSDATLNAIKAQIPSTAKTKVVFALVVTDKGMGDSKDRCEIYAFAGQPTDEEATVQKLAIQQTSWDAGAANLPKNMRHGMKHNAGSPENPVTNAIVLPGVDDLLEVTYPDGEYVGYCVWIGGVLRWF